MSFEFWFLLPVGFLVATVGMSSGVSGSNFWIPIYLLWLRLEPRVAFWMSLLTMLFGFGSGVVRNWRAGTLDLPIARRYLLRAGPAAAVGALLAARLPTQGLLSAFSLFVLVYSVILWRSPLAKDPASSGLEGRPVDPPPAEGMAGPTAVRAVAAGLLQGSIATGAGTVLLPSLLRERRVSHHATAVGTTVLLVFLLSLVSVGLRVDHVLGAALLAHRAEILSMIVFAAPGVVLGGQLGPRLAQQLPRRWLLRYVSALLWAVGWLVLWRALAGS